MNRRVCIKPVNLHAIASYARVAEVQRLRDEGWFVSQLLSAGFSVTEIQRDDSEELCQQCFRPRVMCSCTYLLNMVRDGSSLGRL